MVSSSGTITTRSSVATVSAPPSSRFETRSNNLNAMRLVLAAMVMVSHAWALSYGTADGDPIKRLTLGQETGGSIAVNLFFLISGMLITASWFRSRSMSDFLMRRVLRIYPGFIVALGLSALLIWPLCPEFRHHVGHGLDWAHDLVTDAIRLDYRSIEWPGIFAGNPWPGTSNGSMWTIQREFECYLLVAVIGLFCLFRRRLWILAATVIVSVTYAWNVIHLKPTWGYHQVNPVDHLQSRLYSYFLVGMLFWLFRDKIRFSRPAALVGIAILMAATRIPPSFSLLFLPIGSYLTLYVGLSSSFVLTRWTEKTDISYGVYLYAWPVQEVVAMFPLMRSTTLNLLASLPITAVLAYLSWILVERRFMKMKAARLVDYDPAAQR